MSILNTRDLFDYVGAMEQSSDLPSAIAAAERAFANFGIESFAFAGIVHSPEAVPDAIMAWRYPSELYQLYLDRQMFQFDPAMRFVRRATLPFRWSDVPEYPDQEPLASELRSLVRDFGIDNGMFVPISAADGFHGLVWVAGEKFESADRVIWPLSLLACHTFEHIQRQVGPSSARRQVLTPREKEVATWTALGKTAWEIGEILKITVRTVNEYAQSARRKLGATNRAHMVAIAIRDRLIDL